jgi:uncharacterized membrane protein YfcA
MNSITAVAASAGFMVGVLFHQVAPSAAMATYGVLFLTTGVYAYFKWYRPRKRAKRKAKES